MQSLRYRKRAAAPVELNAGAAATSYSDFDFPAESAPIPDRPQKFRKPSIIVGGGSYHAHGDAHDDSLGDARGNSSGSVGAGGGGVGDAAATGGAALAAARSAAVAAARLAAAAAVRASKSSRSGNINESGSSSSSSTSSSSSSSSSSRSDIFNAIQTLPLTMSTSESAPSTIKRVLTNQNTYLSSTQSLITAPGTTPNSLFLSQALPPRAIYEENDIRFPPLPPRLPFQSGAPEDIGNFSSADEEDVESEDVFIVTWDIAASTPTSLPPAITDLVLAYDGQRKGFNDGAGNVYFHTQCSSIVSITMQHNHVFDQVRIRVTKLWTVKHPRKPCLPRSLP
jgi:hypothetical protein